MRTAESAEPQKRRRTPKTSALVLPGCQRWNSNPVQKVLPLFCGSAVLRLRSGSLRLWSGKADLLTARLAHHTAQRQHDPHA